MGGGIGSARLAAALLLTAVSATGLSAQTYTQDQKTAVALEQLAETYLADKDKWGEAADYYRQAAVLRGDGDAVVVEDLKTAARLEFYRGSGRQAVQDLENAGQQALTVGDVVAAANAFVDAAWVAGSDGESLRANELAEWARLLMRSAQLSPADLVALENRLRTVTS